MRKTLALGCCALIIAFGLVAGMAHVHEAGEHHGESSGLHLDHGHLGRTSGDDHHHGHHDHQHDAVPSYDHAHGVAQDHHHDGVYLNAAARTIGSSVRPIAATVDVVAVFEMPTARSMLDDVGAASIPDNLPGAPPRSRAPPA